ncbi:MAG: hypothetical protein AAF203_04035 [Pseudomonadota bacterium]
MCFKQKIHSIFTFLFFIGSGAVLVATSSLATSGSYYVSSDCVSPIENRVRVFTSSGEITDPPGTTFQDFGLPTTVLTVGGVEGVVGSVSRRCENTYGVDTDSIDDEETLVFSCYDDGAYSCSVVLEEI